MIRANVHLPAIHGDWIVRETQDGLGVVTRRVPSVGGKEEVVLDCVVAQVAANALDLIAEAYAKGRSDGFAAGDKHRCNRIKAAMEGFDD